MFGTNGTNTDTGGNTNSPVSDNNTIDKKARHYMLTINNPETSGEQMEQTFKAFCSKYVYQVEQGASGTKHVQALISFDNPISWKSVKKVFHTAHIEKAKNLQMCIKYCQKYDTRIEGPFIQGYPNFNVSIIKELREWQATFLNEIKNSNDRKIYWVYDKVGNSGKTALAKYMVLTQKAMYVSGKSADIKYAISTYLENDVPKIVIFDYPRSLENYVSYGAIEEVKNGIFFSNKYESKMCIFEPPVVIIFSNFLPDHSQLSEDRWERYHLDNNIITKYGSKD